MTPIERLERLKVVLRQGVPGVHMDMSTWGEFWDIDSDCPYYYANPGTDVAADPATITRVSHELNCGFAACAAGHAMLDPVLAAYFATRGYQAKLTRTGDLTLDYKPAFIHTFTYSALAEMFGISLDDSGYLFDPYTYDVDSIKAEHVIARIDEILADPDNRIL